MQLYKDKNKDNMDSSFNSNNSENILHHSNTISNNNNYNSELFNNEYIRTYYYQKKDKEKKSFCSSGSFSPSKSVRVSNTVDDNYTRLEKRNLTGTYNETPITQILLSKSFNK